MGYTLKISTEGEWRGSILDTQFPVAHLDLVERESGPPGYRSIESEYALKLSSGDTVWVWCAINKENRAGFALRHSEGKLADGKLFTITSEGPFHVEAWLPDGKLYLFELVAG